MVDEVWDGEYHLSPGPTGPHAVLDSQLIILLHPFAAASGLYGSAAFNLGDGPADFRAPDAVAHGCRSPRVGDAA